MKLHSISGGKGLARGVLGTHTDRSFLSESPLHRPAPLPRVQLPRQQGLRGHHRLGWHHRRNHRHGHPVPHPPRQYRTPRNHHPRHQRTRRHRPAKHPARPRPPHARQLEIRPNPPTLGRPVRTSHRRGPRETSRLNQELTTKHHPSFSVLHSPPSSFSP